MATDLPPMVLRLRLWMLAPRRFRFWWHSSCLRYGHFAHRRRLGAVSCALWWFGHHRMPGRRWLARRRLRRMEARWNKEVERGD
ncbi:MAG TPA: hypothetical protein VHI93_01380 [Candidatus Thermoplasmatota archaeon]|nr:hypothetical protein [Candidatus Thermoplasmatota archaeon]